MAQEIIIRLRDVSTGKTFTFPANPESISGTLGAKYQSFDIISKGTVKVPKGTDVSEIKWSGEFFGYSKRKKPIISYLTLVWHSLENGKKTARGST